MKIPVSVVVIESVRINSYPEQDSLIREVSDGF